MLLQQVYNLGRTRLVCPYRYEAPNSSVCVLLGKNNQEVYKVVCPLKKRVKSIPILSLALKVICLSVDSFFVPLKQGSHESFHFSIYYIRSFSLCLLPIRAFVITSDPHRYSTWYCHLKKLTSDSSAKPNHQAWKTYPHVQMNQAQITF